MQTENSIGHSLRISIAMAVRFGGRQNDESRPTTILFEGLDRVDGSARFAFGEFNRKLISNLSDVLFTGSTAALCSVSGPIEVRIAAEHPSHTTFEVLLRPLSNVPGTESKALASTIRNLLAPSIILTHNPRTLMQLVVQSLSPSGAGKFQPSLVAAMINASTMALVSAGSIPMRGVVCAISVGRLRSAGGLNPTLVLDPSDHEIPSLEGGGCFAFLFGMGLKGGAEAVWSDWQSSSPFDRKELLSASKLARSGAEKVWKSMRETLGISGKESQVALTNMEGENDSGAESDDDAMKI